MLESNCELRSKSKQEQIEFNFLLSFRRSSPISASLRDEDDDVSKEREEVETEERSQVNPEDAVTIKKLSKVYKSRTLLGGASNKTAVDNVSVRIRKGEVRSFFSDPPGFTQITTHVFLLALKSALGGWASMGQARARPSRSSPAL